MRDRLFGEHALVYGHFNVLEVGASEGRVVVPQPYNEQLLPGNPGWSADGRFCFVWIGTKLQLCAIDVDSSEVRTLTGLRKVRSGWCSSRMEPEPVCHGPGVIHDAEQDRLLFFLEEPCDDAPALPDAWPAPRIRGRLAAVDVTTRSMRMLDGEAWLPDADCWALSLKRQELYLLVNDPTGPTVRVFSIAGKPIRDIPVYGILPGRLVVSPDQRRLLVGADGYAGGWADELEGLPIDGFGLIDLDTGKFVRIAEQGQAPSWSPDGSRIGYLDGCALKIYSVANGAIEVLAWVEARFLGWLSPNFPCGPVWSPDGETLVTNIGWAAGLQVLDVRRRLVMVLDEFEVDWSMSWAPVPHPFSI